MSSSVFPSWLLKVAVSKINYKGWFSRYSQFVGFIFLKCLGKTGISFVIIVPEFSKNYFISGNLYNF